MGRVSAELGQRVYLDANIVIYVVEGLPTYLDQIRALLTAVNASEIIAVTSELTLAETLVKPFKDQQPALQQAYKVFLTPTPPSKSFRSVAPFWKTLLNYALPQS